MSEINWDAELRKIDREYSGLPPEPSPASVKAKRELERRQQEERDQRRGRVGVYARLVLVAVLSVAIVFWPYPTRCGQGLYGFLGAVSAVVIGGFWIAVLTWRWRMPRTHILAAVAILWGIAIAASQVLPRIGYAKTDADHPVGWSCS
jgi:undecaprenyl pyrophosphate phosphatase UppP